MCVMHIYVIHLYVQYEYLNKYHEILAGVIILFGGFLADYNLAESMLCTNICNNSNTLAEFDLAVLSYIHQINQYT